MCFSESGSRRTGQRGTRNAWPPMVAEALGICNKPQECFTWISSAAKRIETFRTTLNNPDSLRLWQPYSPQQVQVARVGVEAVPEHVHP